MGTVRIVGAFIGVNFAVMAAPKVPEPRIQANTASEAVFARALLLQERGSGVTGTVELVGTASGTKALVAIAQAIRPVMLVLSGARGCPYGESSTAARTVDWKTEFVLGTVSPRSDEVVTRATLDLPDGRAAPAGGWERAVNHAVVTLETGSGGTPARLACGLFKSAGKTVQVNP